MPRGLDDDGCLTFGKFKGETIEDVFNENPWYVKWLYEDPQDFVAEKYGDAWEKAEELMEA
jgi:broad specificity phosphatase PhoE